MPNTPKLSPFPITKLFPNMITIIGLCFGLFAIKFAILGKWEMSVGLIVIAAFIDGLDGGVARLLNASSSFGAQLDSLADFLNFSVAPSLILYMWITHEIKGVGWAVTLFFIICGSLRLARFNTKLEDESEENNPELRNKFFTGVPVTSAAGLSLLPLSISFLFAEKFTTPPFEITPIMVIIYMAIIAFLMVSRIPTISVKNVKIRPEFRSLILASVGLFIAALVLEPWVTLPILGVVYICLIPFSVIKFYKIKKSL